MNRQHDNIDTIIGETLKSQLPREHQDQWFVKKTMNRLPTKRRRLFSTPEAISLILSVVILLMGWGWLAMRFAEIGHQHVDMIVETGVTLMAMSVTVVWMIVSPIVRRG